MNKRVGVIGVVGIPAKYGGFENLVEHLTKRLSYKYDFTVFCSSWSYRQEQKREYNESRLIYLPFKANGIQSIIYDSLSMIIALFKVDTLLILGVSGCYLLPIIKLFTNKKIIVNIDGIEWRRDKWNYLAKVFLKYSERIAIKHADITIADNQGILEYIETTYDKRASLISYGGNHVESVSISQRLKDTFPFLKGSYALKVCRIEPENNIEMVLSAFESLANINLVMIGNWDNSKFGREIRKKYEKFENIHLINPIYSEATLNAIRSNCDVYIHGHSAGGTNPSLVEAMCYGLNIIAYNVNFNIETTENKAKYFSSTKELIKLLENKDNYNKNEPIGCYMKDIAERKYTWEVVCKQYDEIL